MKNDKLCLHNILNSSVTVVGLGISNLPLIRFLLERGVKSITARDRQKKEALSADVLALEGEGVTLICGDGYLDGIDEQVIFRSPGIRPDIPQFIEAVARGALLTSEMELFIATCPATVLAVTGSDGKTTTTTLTYKILSEMAEKTNAFRVFVGGNIGTPLLPRVFEMTDRDFAVIELSSFQLQEIRYTPTRAVITNITPNHLNWHKDYGEYINAKRYIIGKDTHAVLNAKNEETARIADTLAVKTVFSAYLSGAEMAERYPDCERIFLDGGYIVSEKGNERRNILAQSDIRLIGMHNVENYMAAYAITEPYADEEAVARVARGFTGVEHRLEPVRVYRGVQYYNSSIDSSPMRTSTTLSMMKNKNNVVICGGAAKGLTFELLAESLCERARAVVLTGATASDIEKTLLECSAYKASGLEIYKNPDFRSAVELARDVAKKGDTVLLSPACTSFDAFRNFEERGNIFKEIVNGFTD